MFLTTYPQLTLKINQAREEGGTVFATNAAIITAVTLHTTEQREVVHLRPRLDLITEIHRSVSDATRKVVVNLTGMFTKRTRTVHIVFNGWPTIFCYSCVILYWTMN